MNAPKKSSVVATALRKLMREPRFHFLMGGCTLALLALVVWALLSGVTPGEIKSLGGRMLEFAGENPLWLFLAIAVLPALPVPASPFLILAGVVFTPRFGTPAACLLALAAIGLNMTWTYWLASGPGRSLVDRLFDFLEIKLPALSSSNATRLTILLRVTPGIPFFLHNLILGFLRVPFRIYLPISLATTSLFTVGFVVFGNSLSSGRGKLALLAVSLMLMAAVLASFLRDRLAKKGEKIRKADTPPGED